MFWFFFDDVMQSETKQAPALEDYAIEIRTREYLYSENIAGKRTSAGYQEVYITKAGKIKKSTWRKKVKEAIEQAGEKDLLLAIKKHCKEHCAWLKKKRDIENHAMEVLVSRAYRHWKDFEWKEEKE